MSIVLNCPNCEGGPPLEYMTVLTTSVNAVVEDFYDIGRCATCSRQYFKWRKTGTYKAIPREPLCPVCHERRRTVAIAGGIMEMACREHTEHRFRWSLRNDQWERA